MSFKIINAISLYNGGGLTYLYFLKNYLDKKGNILILDYRIKDKIFFSNSNIFLLKRGMFRNFRIFFIRIFYYLNNFFISRKSENKFIEIYLNGIPPFLRFPNSKIYIFCQNRLIFQKNNKFKFFNKSLLKPFLIVVISKVLFNLFIRSTDKIVVQTSSMQNLIKKSFNNRIILQKDIWGEYDKKVIKRIIIKIIKKLISF